MRSLPRIARVYVLTVLLVSFALNVVAVHRGVVGFVHVAFLAALYCIGSAPVATRLRFLGISTGFPSAIAAVFLLGPWQAALVCTLGGVCSAYRTAWYKRAFNVGQETISVFAAGVAYYVASGRTESGFAVVHFPGVLGPVALAAFAYCAMNSVLVAIVIALTNRIRLPRVWWGGMSETLVPTLGYTLLGLIIAVLWTDGVGAVAGVLVLAPMLVGRWAFGQYAEQTKAYEATVASLIQAVETKDYYTRGHSERVSKASVMTGEHIGIRQDRLEMLRYAGMLHDVGKLGVPTKLLQKTGALTDEEFDAIKLHPTRGVEMIDGISFLDEAVRGIRHHHERMDGRGYPDGLRGDKIPEFARVIAVADAFDSMTSTRSYRNARSVDAAIDELRRWSGTQFDPQMVDALIAAVEKNGWETHAERTEEPVDPSILVARDHDDPTADVVVSAIPAPRSEAPIEQVS